MLAKINEEKELHLFPASAIVHASAGISSPIKMKSKMKTKSTKAKAKAAFTNFKDEVASLKTKLGLDKLTPDHLLAIRAREREAKVLAARAAIVGRKIVSVGKVSIHLLTSTSRVRVLYSREASPTEVAADIRTRITALELRSSTFTGELLQAANDKLASLRARLASL
jgi:hypothetical protein